MYRRYGNAWADVNTNKGLAAYYMKNVFFLRQQPILQLVSKCTAVFFSFPCIEISLMSEIEFEGDATLLSLIIILHNSSFSCRQKPFILRCKFLLPKWKARSLMSCHLSQKLLMEKKSKTRISPNITWNKC